MNYTALTQETFKGGMPKKIGQRGADSWQKHCGNEHLYLFGLDVR